jgi:Fe-S cluster biogenesis protein NfuA/nitrite reductase/ring-hydroxylating ferredoxin subunit
MNTIAETEEVVAPRTATRPSAIESVANRVNGSPPPVRGFSQQAKRIQELIARIESLPDASARRLLHECLQSLLGLYGDGLARVLQLVGNEGQDGEKVREALLQDKLVRGLLLVHGLHPDSLETRLRAALDKVRPYLKSHGGNVELIDLENDVAQLRLEGTCKSCPSSSVTLELAVRDALEESCPDLEGFEVEGVAPSDAPKMHLPAGAPQWTVIEGLGELQDGEIHSQDVANVPVMICKVRGILYAYRNRCPGCTSSFDRGTLATTTTVLACPAGHRFDVQHAGRCPDDTGLHLDPFPLLALNGAVKVSVR